MSTPKVSIVMPTYNRRDTILRAIESVRAQAFEDWELVIVDDGSTDGTRDLLAGVDPRVRVLVQENRGVAGARNAALAASRGALIAFLDSDDEWPRHHLAFATAFFDAHPGEHAMSSEFWEDFGNHDYVKHFRVETGDWYPTTARNIGSRAFATPPKMGDPYLWFYDTRSPIGDWSRRAIESTSYGEPVFHYRGDVFRGWRWGWLMALQPTVITRHAMEAVGPNDESYEIAADFGYLAEICRRFTMNFFSLPGCLKHELTADGRPPSEDHLVTGRSATRFHQDVLRFHEELFWKASPDDPELSGLRGFRQSLVGRAALAQGDRDVALANLEEAVKTYPGAETSAMLWLARLPQGKLASSLYRGWQKGGSIASRVRSKIAAAGHP